MSKDIVIFFNIYRQIFGICPCCGNVFRLSDAKISVKKKFKIDWYEKIEKKLELLSEKELRLEELRISIQEKARERGYKKAINRIKKIDPIFSPRKLDPDDAKVIFNPIDYSVFHGMRSGNIKKIILLDRKLTNNKRIQKSIEKTIEKENYEWKTLRVLDNGEIEEE